MVQHVTYDVILEMPWIEKQFKGRLVEEDCETQNWEIWKNKVKLPFQNQSLFVVGATAINKRDLLFII